ncbi:NAD-glutamate dehydrogenase domain-containing protein, partial [Pseudomonas sp.]|uniref:NAD-glutamate dehydrogenase domain-containing protein n=2 Tax=Pseudomonas TaxID=286 RepID=UPI0028A59075
GQNKSYFSFKFNPKLIPELPKPVPKFEIFVYSPRVEGVHLRFGNVARGGLRWSDREEDFRTEVLGLVKAQQVKNSVIVPVGAKGGFLPRRLPLGGTRDEIAAEGVACYRIFISGLLDITDNLKDGGVVPPANVVRHDDDDPYLVVAADKGTATFSDIANGIAIDYGFWLGDAFASGGSAGYDHKKMGITARGAWVGVQRHFRERGINVQQDPITVIGVGDMAGDVFGNGLLMSDKLQLVAAFNHLHIFIDPNPDPATSFVERKRLFDLPRSAWSDYDTSIMSEGGGIFPRSAKSIAISPQMKERFAIEADRLTPTELLHALLKAPVDLLWNGGIGTYVKASSESHADVGDKANDALRVNGNELRCKVVGEGGNLGMTQLGRVEFGLQGGATNTDFIDNAGGVDCSDHEVNIKILLNEVVQGGDMTEKQRNQLLGSMTDEVAGLVLGNNYKQTQALSLAARRARERIAEYKRLMADLESRGKLDRAIEFLPSEEQLAERLAAGQGLTRAELSVLISYSKIDLKEQLLKSLVPDD